MAFKDVNQKYDKFKAYDLEIGESIEGFFVGYSEYRSAEDDRTTYNVLLKIDGAVKLMQVCGNLSYLYADNKLTIGQNTRITRNDDVPAKKKGQKKSHFTVEQDPDNVIEVAEEASTQVTIASGQSATIASGANEATTRTPTRAEQRQASLDAKSKRLTDEGGGATT